MDEDEPSYVYEGLGASCGPEPMLTLCRRPSEPGAGGQDRPRDCAALVRADARAVLRMGRAMVDLYCFPAKRITLDIVLTTRSTRSMAASAR